MLGRTSKRIGAGLALTGALLIGTGGGAWAHECFIASRSAQGNAMAGSNSKAWFTLNIDEAIAGDVESGAITPDQGECITAWWAESGNPSSFTIHVAGKQSLAENNPNKGLMSNGKGVDHLFDAYGEDIMTAYGSCGAEFPMG